MALIAIAVAASFSTANAGTLHVFCWGGTTCSDSGTNAPTYSNPPKFGFTDTAAQTGDFSLDILVPNNLLRSPASVSFLISGDLNGTATLVDPVAWTTGKLDGYLGLAASPKNPIGAYLPSELALNPGATGFYVYDVDFGNVTLSANQASAQHLTTSALIQGSYILAFLSTGSRDVATPNSNALFDIGLPPPDGGHVSTTPLPATLGLMAPVLAGGGLLLRYRSRRKAS